MQGQKPPTIWGAGRGQQQYLTLVQANADTCSSETRLEELDALFWRHFRADIVGLEEVRRTWDNRSGHTCGGGKYVLFHSAAATNETGAAILGVGILVRNNLVPTLISLRLLGPRLLVAKFRGSQRNLTVIVAHAPTGKATDDERTAFYASLADVTSATAGISTQVVLMDANAGPGKSRKGWEHIVGPHGIAYPVSEDTKASCDGFGQYCFDHNLCIGHTGFQHKDRHKLTFYPNAEQTGKPRDMDHVLIDGRSSSCLENCKTAPGAVISPPGTTLNGELAGHRAVVATLHCRLKAIPGNDLKKDASYIRSDCLKKEVQKEIQATLASDAPHYVMANGALVEAGHFGMLPG